METVEQDRSLNRLSSVYGELTDDEKGKIIRLAEGLLDVQSIVEIEGKGMDFENELRICVPAVFTISA